MSKKMIYFVSFVLVLGLVGNVSADVSWNDAGPDHLWSTGGNWATGAAPTTLDGYVRIGMVPGPTIANEGAVAAGIHIGNSGDVGELTVDGGTLEVLGGSFNLGRSGSGTLNMISGTITMGNTFKIGRDAGGIGHANLDGGIFSANNFVMREKADSVGTMDVSAGTLIINGDRLSLVQGYIDNGWITAYDGNGTLQMDYDVTNEGQTTLTAIHNLNPNPANGSLVSAGQRDLSWTLPDPCTPDQSVSVDVYFTDDLNKLVQFTDPASMQVVSQGNVTSVSVQTVPKRRYYWAIDSYIGSDADPVYGPIFSFVADNLPPQVDAGADAVTWLEDGVRTKNLGATVSDDEAYTVQWTVISEPNEGNAVIETIDAEDTSITLLAVGEYVMQLDASDGEYTGSDTVTINVYNDGCEAAQSLPDYEPSPGDLNGDCIVNDLDLAILQEDWLKDTSLTEP